MFSNASKIAVCGAGAMGAGIAQVAAQAGHNVVVLDRDQEALARGKASIAKGAAALLKRGKLDEIEAAALEARISWTLAVDDLADATLIIEAIAENADIKQSLFEKLEAILSDEAVLATNTSSLSVTSLAAKLKRPARFLGLHFFNPAPIMKLVEVVHGSDTSEDVADAAFNLMKSWGKVAVKAKDVPGFIVNRVARPYYSEGWRAYEEGVADASTLDFLYRDLAGFRMGPLELGDFIGHDINYEAARSIYEAYHGRTRFLPALSQGQLVAAGQLGRKSGRGVYAYGDDGIKPEPAFAPNALTKELEVRIADDAEEPIKDFLTALGVPLVVDNKLKAPCAAIGNVLVDVTFGPTAARLSGRFQTPFATLDWARDAKSASAIAFAASSDQARNAILQLAAVSGKNAIELTDRPGLVVFRTLAQLANCAADAVRDRVADPDSIDQAMINGVNYPFGPTAWADKIGFNNVVEALESIAEWTGEPMYNPSEALRTFAEAETVL